LVHLRILRAFCFVTFGLGAVTMTGCGGGNVTIPVRHPVTSVTQTQTLAGAGQTDVLPSFAGFTPSFVVPSGAPAGTTATFTVGTSAPAGAAAPLSSSINGSPKAHTAAAASDPSVLLYIQAIFSNTFDFANFPTFTFTVPSGVNASGLTLEIFNGTDFLAGAAGTATGQSVTFTFLTPGPFSIVAGEQYVIELVSGSNLNLSFIPNDNGDAFTYTGTLSKTFVLTPQLAPPTPNPNPPTSTQSLTANVSIGVAVASSPAPAGGGTVSTFTSNETDAFTSPPETETSTTNEILAFSPPASSGAVTVTEQGATTTTPTTSVEAGSTIATTIGAGNGLIDVIPEVPGPLTPANTAAETINETDATGQTEATTFNADGSYTETINYPPALNLTSTATVNSDGSANYAVPFDGVPGSSVAFAAPAGGNIGITVTLAAALVGQANPLVETFTIQSWYPSPTLLYSQTYQDNGGVAAPSSCGIPSNLARPTNQLVQTTNTVDPAFGELETNTTTTYDAQGLGVVCTVLNDVTTSFYDFTNQTQGFAFNFSPNATPFETTTLAETIGMQSATVVGTAAVAHAPASAQAVLARAVTGHFEALVVHERALRHAAELKKLQAALKLRIQSMKGSH